MRTSNLKIKAGLRASQRLLSRGLKADDVHIMAGAAGGPKWLILKELDAYLIQEFFPRSPQKRHFIGSSAGAWRAACHAHPEPLAALEALHEEYIHQSYSQVPSAEEVSNKCRDILESSLLSRGIKEIPESQSAALHIITSRARFNSPDQSWQQKLVFAQSALHNLFSRKEIERFFVREIFSNSPEEILQKDILQTQRQRLNSENFLPALLASGSIPSLMKAVNIQGKEYWDGGITDYHLDLNYALEEGLVLYPHFKDRIIPGWLDKYHPFRKAHPEYAQNTVLLYPSEAFIAKLPRQKIPDRQDFTHYGADTKARVKAWQEASKWGEALVEDFIRLQNPDTLAENLRSII